MSFCTSVLKRFGLLTFFLLPFWVSACSTTPTVVKVGLVAPFEGEMRAVGYDAIYAARIAVRQANGSNDLGRSNFRVALVALDDGGDPASAQAVANALILDPSIVAVVGHGLPESNSAVAEIYAAAGLEWIPLGEGEYAPYPETQLSDAYRALYQAATPFDEAAGPYAGPTADAMHAVLTRIGELQMSGGPVTRENMLKSE